MNSKKSLALFLPLAVASSLAFADTYRTELSLGLEGSAFELSALDDIIVTEGAEAQVDLGLQVFFSEVQTDKGPYAKAAFLDKASSVALSASYAVYEDDEVSGVSSDETYYDNFNSASTRIVLAEKFTLNLSAASNGRQSHQLGTYLNDSMELLIGYEKIDDGSTITETAFPLTGVELYQEKYTLGVEAVQPLSGEQSVSYEGNVAAIDGSSGDGFGVQLSSTYYFTNAIGLGLNLAYDEYEYDDVDATEFDAGLDFSYYITPSYSVSAAISYSELEYEDVYTIEGASFGVAGSARF